MFRLVKISWKKGIKPYKVYQIGHISKIELQMVENMCKNSCAFILKITEEVIVFQNWKGMHYDAYDYQSVENRERPSFRKIHKDGIQILTPSIKCHNYYMKSKEIWEAQRQLAETPGRKQNQLCLLTDWTAYTGTIRIRPTMNFCSCNIQKWLTDSEIAGKKQHEIVKTLE